MAIEAFDLETKEILEKRVVNFGDTSEEVLAAISSFNWLWPAFEKLALKNLESDALGWGRLRNLAELDFISRNDTNPVQMRAFDYFKDRYISGAGADGKQRSLFTYQPTNQLEQFRESFREEANDLQKRLGLLQVVYRLRNNLFHGTKGGIGLTLQGSNFEHANALLKLWLRHNLDGTSL